MKSTTTLEAGINNKIVDNASERVLVKSPRIQLLVTKKCKINISLGLLIQN